MEARSDDGTTYYWNQQTNESSWSRPVGAAVDKSALRAELLLAQEALAAASAGNRCLSITLCLTGCKQEEIQPDASAKPGSPAEMITHLLAVTDPTGKPYITIKAGRPNWKGEFKAIADK